MTSGKTTFFGRTLGKQKAKELGFDPSQHNNASRYVFVFTKGRFPSWNSYITWTRIDLFKMAVVKVYGQAKKGEGVKKNPNMQWVYPWFSEDQISKMFEKAIQIAEKRKHGHRKTKSSEKSAFARLADSHQTSLCELCFERGGNCMARFL